MIIIKKAFKKLKKKFLKPPTAKNSCNNGTNPKPNYKDISWVKIAITEDQLRIENVLSELTLNNKRLLHVGIGSSNIAKKLTEVSVHIDGITVMHEEKEYASSLNLKNYNVYLINKYSNELNSLNSKYDFIIDNNLSSFACCKQHYHLMIKNYINILNKDGMLLTDKVGMSYYEDYAFGIEYTDLKKIESLFPVKALKLTDSVFALKKI